MRHRGRAAGAAVTRVMVVDDHPMWRDAVARDLQEAGHEVVATAADGGEAVRRAPAARPEVVVLDREAHGRFARELSDRLGAVTIALALEGEVVRFRIFERGRMVDEYLSVPTWYGELPKGDELALAANPTLVSRLTGASRDDVRRIARTAATPAELPPAPELFEQIARLMGLEA